ncbi:MAG: Na+/H+ antiporter subunit E [Endomicrobia bacterium]|nr:Na+/H+ antiporter subunit E [Endomicrobiia bacterium]MCX7940532.1 Na+/H+ antiporter subunit E [Endomicrobiia bacterium]MDW8056017.1 Na+/H+ antiporter subunit E [Elusimicrobiota bacterium]
MIYRKIFLTLLIFVIWIILSGVELYNILVGIFCSILIVLLFGDINIQNQWTVNKPQRYLWFIYYFIVFLYEVIKANLDVAYRIILPNMPIKPGIVRVKTKLKSDAGLTLLANSITLTPGTLSVDIDKDNGYIYVHWIYVRDINIEETTKKISWKFEKILLKIFP